MLYRFNNVELDAERFQLRRDGVVQHVEPLVFDLLHFFCQNPERVIGRDEMIDQVWKGRVVSETTVSSCVKSARKALGDSGESQTFIRTVRGRGFEFVGVDDGAGAHRAPSPSHQPNSISQQSATQQSSLVVLPFQVFGEDAELAGVADGLVENLTSILTRVPLLSLISRTSSFALKAENVDAAQIRLKLGATYMLEGSLQEVGGRVRANVQLIETKNGFHLWAQQFDHPRGPNVVVDLLHGILARLEPQLVRAMFNDLQGESDQLNGRQLLLQAMGLLTLKGWHRNTFIEAADLLRRSIDQEPALALAHAYLSLILAFGHRVGLLRESDDVVQEAVSEAETALELDDMDSHVVGLAACALADVGQADRAIPLLRKAVAINPNNGQALAALGSVLMVNGFAEEAVENLVHGIRISPMDNRIAVWGAFLTMAYLERGELDRALDAARDSCQADDKNYLPKVAVTAVHLARAEAGEAVKALKECYRVKPDLSLQEIDRIVGADLGGAIRKLCSQTDEHQSKRAC